LEVFPWGEKMVLSKNEHLDRVEIMRTGSFFTPFQIAELSKEWLQPVVKKEDYVMDFGVGYGAFVSHFLNLSDHCFATDFDATSISFVRETFPSVKTFLENSLIDICRQKYNIPHDSRLFIIGNPPYNDVTSQYRKGQKGNFDMDPIVYSRDLGISFLKMYSLLDPEYICVIHPLSYLIKKNNFLSLGGFRNSYSLKKGTIFSSKEFESIGKGNLEFPVLLALYEKGSFGMRDFSQIKDFQFSIFKSNTPFSLSKIETIDGWIQKYPSKGKEDSDLQFYTIRDINALMRNKTFLIGRCPNGVKVSISDLYKYSWLDYFKTHFRICNQYLVGNLSPFFSKDLEEDETKKELVSYIMLSNQTVCSYYENNHLSQEVLNYYAIKSLSSEFPKLEKIIHKMASVIPK